MLTSHERDPANDADFAYLEAAETGLTVAPFTSYVAAFSPLTAVPPNQLAAYR